MAAIRGIFAVMRRGLQLQVSPAGVHQAAAMRRAALSLKPHRPSPPPRLRRRAVRTRQEESRKLLLAGVVGTVSLGGAGFWFFTADNDSINKVKRFLSDSPLGKAFDWLEAQIEEIGKPFANPAREQLLPDWPPFPDFPPDVPCPPTLIIDLEDTLVHSEWDRKYGWRHAKRPGVDEFLREVAKYYETVIFTSNISAIAEPVINSLDKEGMIMHRLYRDCTTYRKGVHVKDLSRMNRDIRRIVIIDDDPRSYQFQPENAISIKPFTNGQDRSDTALLDLIPFLRALATEGIDDFREVLAEYKGKDVAAEYNRKLAQIEAEIAERQQKRRKKGLMRGGFLGGPRSAVPSDGSS